VLASVRRSGHPHLSTVLYHWDPKERVLRISTTADRLKVRQLRHDPHATLHVTGPNVWSFAVAVAIAEGEAEVSGVTTMPGDAIGRELLALTLTALSGGLPRHGPNYEEAHRKLVELQAQHHQGVPVAANNLLIGDYLEHRLASDSRLGWCSSPMPSCAMHSSRRYGRS
jgi:hypothetical protein